MKKAIILFSILTFSLAASAYVEEASTNKYADKFKPSSGVKIKESSLASRMENATRNAAYGNKEEKNTVRRKETRELPATRTYKWF